MFGKFLRNIMINQTIAFYILRHFIHYINFTEKISFKHFYRREIKTICYFGSKTMRSKQSRRLIGCIKYWGGWRRVVLASLDVQQNFAFSHWALFEVVKSWKSKRCVYSWSKNWTHIRVNISSVILQVFLIIHLLHDCVHPFCTCTW